MAHSPKQRVSLASRIRALREAKGMSLDEVASKAKISKTYLWELERDTTSSKKPSADVLLRIATALSTTIADLMSLPSVRVQEVEVEIPRPLLDLADNLKKMGEMLSPEDLHDLSLMKFRGGQPQTAEEWHSLYLLLKAAARRPKP